MEGLGTRLYTIKLGTTPDHCAHTLNRDIYYQPWYDTACRHRNHTYALLLITLCHLFRYFKMWVRDMGGMSHTSDSLTVVNVPDRCISSTKLTPSDPNMSEQIITPSVWMSDFVTALDGSDMYVTWFSVWYSMPQRLIRFRLGVVRDSKSKQHQSFQTQLKDINIQYRCREHLPGLWH